MSKPASGLFARNTSIVWNHIKAIQDSYPGTKLHRSFTIDTPAGKMWTHGNATEHMQEAIQSINPNPAIKNSNPDMYTQFILYDYWNSLGKVVNSGNIPYDRKVTNGHWEFVFAKPRGESKYPVVKHAKFSGLN